MLSFVSRAAMPGFFVGPKVAETKSTVIWIFTNGSTQANASLLNQGFGIYAAKDGLEAILILTKYRVDVLLTDVNMPRIDGYALLRFVKTQNLKSLQIIAMTSKSKYSDQELLIAGAHRVFEKPLKMASLMEELSNRPRANLTVR